VLRCSIADNLPAKAWVARNGTLLRGIAGLRRARCACDGTPQIDALEEKPDTSAIKTPPQTMFIAQDKQIPAKAPMEPIIALPHRMVEKRSESTRMVAPGASRKATTGTTPEALKETTEPSTS
jgi:hypothetical protein